jgi:hypothetical protein
MVASIVFPYVADAASQPTGIKITSKAKAVDVSKKIKLSATVTPKGAKTKITWSSSSKAIATVDKSGNVTGVKAGKATITAKTSNGKSAKFTVTVNAAKVGPGTVLWEQSKEKKADARVYTAKYNSYKYHVSAIYLCPYNLYYDGRDKKVGAAVDNLGRTLRFQGEYKLLGGPDAPELLIQTNNTQPKSYPIRWQTNIKKPIKPGKWNKFNFTFTLEKNAKNGDTDSSTGYNWPILLYFANKPNNKMIYKPGNDWQFRNCKITVVK